MRLDRNTAAIIAHGDEIILIELDRDDGSVARHRLIHRIVYHFGKQMMQRLLIRAANIHARTTTNGLEPLQNLNRLSGITTFTRRAEGGLGLRYRFRSLSTCGYARRTRRLRDFARCIATKEIVGHRHCIRLSLTDSGCVLIAWLGG